MRSEFRLSLGDFNLNAAFDAPDKGVTALFGPSGSGKTSILRCVAGLARATEGYFRIDDDVWQDESAGVFIPCHKRPIGYVFQDSRLFDHLDVMGNLTYGYKRIPKDDRRIEIEQVVEWLSLESLLKLRPYNISGGQKQRVAIGRALLTSPKLMLFDEPLASLDETSKSEIFPYLIRLHDELSIPALYVSHSLDEVSRIADNMALIKDGAVIATGPLSETMTRLDLPISKGDAAGAAINARVAGHDTAYHLTWLEFAGGMITIPRNNIPEGSDVRVRILARDVSLALEKPERTSVLNIIPARVVEVETGAAPGMMVKLDAGGATILARITRKSGDTLRLNKGMRVFAMVKSVALV